MATTTKVVNILHNDKHPRKVAGGILADEISSTPTSASPSDGMELSLEIEADGFVVGRSPDDVLKGSIDGGDESGPLDGPAEGLADETPQSPSTKTISETMFSCRVH